MVSIHKCDASILDEGAKICKKKRVNMNEGRQTWGYVRLWTCVVCQDSTPDLLCCMYPHVSLRHQTQREEGGTHVLGSPRIVLFRDARQVRGTCEAERYGRKFEGGACVVVRARSSVSDVESTGG